VEFVRNHSALEPSVLVEAIRQEVFEFSAYARLSDDLTSVAIRVEE
jgi:serine phosphatase RsbU (regulator of sigma subunit)